MSKFCHHELGRAAKRMRHEEDRLTHLPDFILHHILSFLDTKHAVRTSVLSRAWRCAWKHVPVLYFDGDTFRNSSSFVRFVNKVMSQRYAHDPVSKISFLDEAAKLEQKSYRSMFQRFMKYAHSRGTQHLTVLLRPDSAISKTLSSSLSSNLTSVELRSIRFDSGFGSTGLPMLTALKLVDCELYHNDSGVFDLISNFPRLMDFVVSCCGWSDEGPMVKSTKIYGPQLISLKMDRVCNAEIIAPKLELFSVRFSVGWDGDFHESKLSMPCLVRAEILALDRELDWIRDKDNKELKMERYLDNMLRGLHNAASLMIRCDDDELVKKIFDRVTGNHSLFTRLKSFGSQNVPQGAHLSEDSSIYEFEE